MIEANYLRAFPARLDISTTGARCPLAYPDNQGTPTTGAPCPLASPDNLDIPTTGSRYPHASPHSQGIPTTGARYPLASPDNRGIPTTGAYLPPVPVRTAASGPSPPLAAWTSRVLLAVPPTFQRAGLSIPPTLTVFPHVRRAALRSDPGSRPGPANSRSSDPVDHPATHRSNVPVHPPANFHSNVPVRRPANSRDSSGLVACRRARLRGERADPVSRFRVSTPHLVGPASHPECNVRATPLDPGSSRSSVGLLRESSLCQASGRVLAALANRPSSARRPLDQTVLPSSAQGWTRSVILVSRTCLAGTR